MSAGKIHHAAPSAFPPGASRAVALVDPWNRAPIVGIQYEYSLAERAADRHVPPVADLQLPPVAEALGHGAAL
ncbi:aldo-keto reductase family protein [Streptomyces pratensis]|uniref:hypothetical protein n=1 Tax=Streptomyces pratensis TaxID=1169025 RepID=UPI00362D4D45